MTKAGEKILFAARKIIRGSALCSFVTIGLDGAPRSRFIGTFVIDKSRAIHLVCQAGSNKTREIARCAKSQLVFWSRDFQIVVSLSGSARMVWDAGIRRRVYQKTAPLRLFPEFDDSFAVIRFIPQSLEYLNLKFGEQALKAKCHGI